jgi:hypothetical protein
MRILADRHHADLYEALARLFVDRLGGELFTPVGMEWWDERYWRFGEVFGDDRLARQYLVLNETWREVEPGLFLTFDQHHPARPLYGVTLEAARSMEWDYTCATVQDNQYGFCDFATERGATYLYQVGNTNQHIDWSLEPIVLNASEMPLVGRGVAIGQEFDLGIFRYRPPLGKQRVASFVNLLPRIPEMWSFFDELRGLLPDHRFRSFGHDCPDGLLRPVAAIADEMARTDWAFHDKTTGDGFGHIIHNWAAIGRPLIGHASYYAGKLAEPFWQDGVTCIDLDRHSVAEAAEVIRSTTPDQLRAMCEAIRATFDATVDFAADAERVRELLA